MRDSRPPRIMDYEGSNYRTDFWEGRGRQYEDQVERAALRKLLPATGRRLLEIGGGYGRLTNEYDAFQQVVLLDYSFSQLQYAQQQYGRSERYLYVAADAYQLPFQPGTFDATTMIRVIHHMAYVPQVLQEIRRVMTPEAIFILEHANKRHLKSIGRYLLRRQTWNPFSYEPVEFVELNFDFHPEYIINELEAAGFEVQRRLPTSFFRLGILKNTLPMSWLVWMDKLLQNTGLFYTPSIFTRSKAVRQSPSNLDLEFIFANPGTGDPLVREGDEMFCPQTGDRYAIRDGIFDFKAKVE